MMQQAYFDRERNEEAMKRNALKWTILGGAMAIIIMYGIDMSTSGIERIYGPIDGVKANSEIDLPQETTNPVEVRVSAQQQKIEQLEKELAELKRLTLAEETYPGDNAEELPLVNERLPGVPLENSQPAVNRIADSTSGLLQNMSSEGIKMVVSIFDGLTK